MRCRNGFYIRRWKYITNRARSLFLFTFSRQNTNSFRSRGFGAVAPDTSTSIAAQAKPAEKPITTLSVYTGSRLYARPRNVFPLRSRMQRETCSYPRHSGRSAFGEKLPKKPRVAVSILDDLRRNCAIGVFINKMQTVFTFVQLYVTFANFILLFPIFVLWIWWYRLYLVNNLIS